MFVLFLGGSWQLLGLHVCFFPLLIIIFFLIHMKKIPMYYLFLFKMTRKVASELEKFQKDFLWEGGGSKKDHLVKWETMVKAKEYGGLGINGLKEGNIALLGK